MKCLKCLGFTIQQTDESGTHPKCLNCGWSGEAISNYSTAPEPKDTTMMNAPHDDEESPAPDRYCEAILKCGERSGKRCPARKKPGHPYCARHVKELDKTLGQVLVSDPVKLAGNPPSIPDQAIGQLSGNSGHDEDKTPKDMTLAKLFDRRSVLYRELDQVEIAIQVVTRL